jgi:glycerol kinase
MLVRRVLCPPRGGGHLVHQAARRGLATGRRLVGSIDQGTTSTRFILFDNRAHAVASHQMEHAQIYPRDGWCEHDPIEIIDNARACIDAAVAKLPALGYSASDVAAVGITNQRETTLVWDKLTGQPLHNAVVWLDLRTDAIARELAEQGGKDRFRAVTGLPVSTYFSAVKLAWLMRNVPEVSRAVAEGRALFGTIDTWLLWNLSGGHEGGGKHVTDVTNASRTMLMDLASCALLHCLLY